MEHSRAWNDTVHGAHEYYDDMPFASDDSDLHRTLQKLARWWLLLLLWRWEDSIASLLENGQRERLTSEWFHRWIEGQLGSRVKDLLAHHIRCNATFELPLTGAPRGALPDAILFSATCICLHFVAPESLTPR